MRIEKDTEGVEDGLSSLKEVVKKFAHPKCSKCYGRGYLGTVTHKGKKKLATCECSRENMKKALYQEAMRQKELAN